MREKKRKMARKEKEKRVGPKKVSPTQLLLLIIRNMFVIRYTFVIVFVPAPPTNPAGRLLDILKGIKRKKNGVHEEGKEAR